MNISVAITTNFPLYLMFSLVRAHAVYIKVSLIVIDSKIFLVNIPKTLALTMHKELCSLIMSLLADFFHYVCLWTVIGSALGCQVTSSEHEE